MRYGLARKRHGNAVIVASKTA